MLLLAFDTAGPNCAVAVARAAPQGPQMLAHLADRIGRGHAERLPAMVDEAVAAAKISHADLDRIAVTSGPGSFTGVRVGIAFARGLALALDIPAIGIGSLDALIHPLMKKEAGTAAALFDARRGAVFALVRDIASGTTLIDAEALSADDVASRLRSTVWPLTLTGSGAMLVANTLEETGVAVANEAESPDIADVVALAFETESSGPPTPLYARGPDAKPQLAKAVARA